MSLSFSLRWYGKVCGRPNGRSASTAVAFFAPPVQRAMPDHGDGDDARYDDRPRRTAPRRAKKRPKPPAPTAMEQSGRRNAGRKESQLACIAATGRRCLGRIMAKIAGDAARISRGGRRSGESNESRPTSAGLLTASPADMDRRPHWRHHRPFWNSDRPHAATDIRAAALLNFGSVPSLPRCM